MNILHYIFILIAIGSPKAEHSAQTNYQFRMPSEIIAGEKLHIEIGKNELDHRLIIQSSYAKTVLVPIIKGDRTYFAIPAFISEKSGIIDWKLMSNRKNISGKLKVLSGEKPEIIENYFGPRSIQAGKRDYSMLVSIPTDRFDNPLEDGTKVEVSEYFMGSLVVDSITMKNMFAWKNIYSKEKSGKITIANTCKSIQAKEMISLVYPSTPENFEIHAEREHEYADGNQVTKIITSKILDEFGNTVSDGTAVEFLIREDESAILKTMSTTINGIATAKILHPEKPVEWEIQANITGMAESNIIDLDYKPVINDFNIELKLGENLIVVGPIRSFVNQFIPDGAAVKLEVLDKKGAQKFYMKKPTESGYAIFKLSKGENYQDSYTFKIEALGVTKSIQ